MLILGLIRTTGESLVPTAAAAPEMHLADVIAIGS